MWKICQMPRRLYDQQAKERQRTRKGHQAGAMVENLPQLDKARDAAGSWPHTGTGEQGGRGA